MSSWSLTVLLAVSTILGFAGAASFVPLAGVAYFNTNRPDGNKIIASNINLEGKLAFASVTNAGGVGSKGINSPFTFDSIFSSGSIRVSPRDNLLVALNVGSNTLAIFEIDKQTPSKLTMIGEPINSGGDFPISIAFNNDGDKICVLNGGAVNGVKCFVVSNQNGLTLIETSLRLLHANATTPPSGPLGSFSQIIFSETGSQLIALKKGLSVEESGFFAVWDVDNYGNLSAQARVFNVPGPGYAPYSLTIIPGRNAYLTADVSLGADVFTFDGDAKISETSLIVPGQGAICWSSYSPQTGNYYVNDGCTGIVTEIHVDEQLKPSITAQYPQEDSISLLDNTVAHINGQDYLYNLSPSSLTIQVLRLNAPGKAEDWQSYNFTSAAESHGAAIDGPHVAGMAVYLV